MLQLLCAYNIISFTFTIQTSNNICTGLNLSWDCNFFIIMFSVILSSVLPPIKTLSEYDHYSWASPLTHSVTIHWSILVTTHWSPTITCYYKHYCYTLVLHLSFNNNQWQVSNKLPFDSDINMWQLLLCTGYPRKHSLLRNVSFSEEHHWRKFFNFYQLSSIKLVKGNDFGTPCSTL